MKSKPQITTALPPIFQIKSKKNSPLNNIYTKFPAVNPPRGRQLYKKAYDLLNNQEINISNNSTCETKRIINNNIKNKKESRPVRIHNRRITKDKSPDYSISRGIVCFDCYCTAAAKASKNSGQLQVPQAITLSSRTAICSVRPLES